MQKNPRNLWQRTIDALLSMMRWAMYVICDPVRLAIARRTWKPNNNPLISIIIPTRNRWGILKDRAIPSILAQTYKNWELIIVDDGSQVEYWEFYPPVIKENHRINVYRIEKKFHYPKNAWCRWCAGPVRALNFALSKVKGDYILRIDDDDILKPIALERLLRAIEFNNVEFVSAIHTAKGHIVEPYLIRERWVGGIQTILMRSYLRCFKYNPNCWRKKRNSPNEIDLIDRMLRAGVTDAYICCHVTSVLPRPGQTEVGWKSQQKEYSNNV